MQTLQMTIDGQHWTTAAACSDVSPDELFVAGAAQREARNICEECPVRLQCLADALDAKYQHGVWGGMTERERRAILRRYPEVDSWAEYLVVQGEPPSLKRAKAPKETSSTDQG